MTYTIDYFLDKFSKIPEELWCIKALQNFSEGFEQRCFIGWCYPAGVDVEKQSEQGIYCEENMASARLFTKLKSLRSEINNGEDPKYQQPTPRQRILAALRDIKALQDVETKVVPEVKERIVYVMRDEKVRELSKAELSEQ